MDDWPQLSLVILAIAVVAAVNWYSRRLDRARIGAHVARHGGQVLKISSYSFGFRGHGSRCYDVRYMTAARQVLTRTCTTSALNDVRWFQSVPPGCEEYEKSKAAAAGIFRQEQEYSLSAPEAITCLACGGNIPESSTRCPNCGRSYQTR